MLARIQFNNDKNTYDGYVGKRVVSRAKTIKGVVKTLVKNYRVPFIQASIEDVPKVIRFKQEFNV